MPDVHDADNLLSNNNLPKNQFEFIECFVHNCTIYGYELKKNSFLEKVEKVLPPVTVNKLLPFSTQVFMCLL